MENLFLLLLLVSLFLLAIGLFNPKTSLFWYKKERTRKVSLLTYGLCSIIFFVLFGVTLPDSHSTKENLNKAEQQGPISSQQKDSIATVQKQNEIEARKQNTVTAGDLILAYSKNEVAADKAFKGTSFYVTGYVEHVGKDIMDNSYVTLKSGDPIRSIQCFVEDQDMLSQLQVGQKITVYGECDGLMMNVLMRNCKIVNNL